MKKTLFAIIAMCLLSGAAYKTEKPKVTEGCSSDGWCMNIKHDDFDDYYTLYVTKDSLNRDNILNQQPYLVIKCKGGVKSYVQVNWKDVVDITNYNDTEHTTIDYRFDKTPKGQLTNVYISGEARQWTTFQDNTFIGKVIKHNKLVMKVDIHGGSSTLKFDLKGAKKALAPLAEYCEWEL